MKTDEKKPKILGVITARGGSKGIPGKNIKLLGGKPLIAYTIEVSKKSKLLSHLIISTDDEEIAMVAGRYGVEVPFMRPREFADDKAPHLPVMKHAIEFMEKQEGIVYDYVVILQPTSPFRTVEDLDGTIQKLIDTKADSAVSVSEIPGGWHPVKIKKLEGDKLLPYCMPEEEGIRRQDLPVAYKRNGSVYAMKRNIIMVNNRLFGDNVVGFITPKERTVDIDTPVDWVLAEYIFEELRKKGQI